MPRSPRLLRLHALTVVSLAFTACATKAGLSPASGGNGADAGAAEAGAAHLGSSADAAAGTAPDAANANANAPDAANANANAPDALASGSPSDAGPSGFDASPCPGAFVCDDFEQYAAGAAPTGPWTAATNAGTVAVDTTRAYSGTKSVKITAPAATGYRSVMLRIGSGGLLPVAGNVVYGRMMFWLDSAPTTSVHFTLVDGSGLIPDAGYHAVYRYGGQLPLTGSDGGFLGSQMMASYDTTDSYAGVGPSTDCFLQSQGRVVPVGAWTCIEWQFDGPDDTLHLWIGGVAATDLTVAHTGMGCISQPAGYEWTSPTFSQLDIGLESYQADGPRTMWIDDAAFATSRVGCP